MKALIEVGHDLTAMADSVEVGDPDLLMGKVLTYLKANILGHTYEYAYLICMLIRAVALYKSLYEHSKH